MKRWRVFPRRICLACLMLAACAIDAVGGASYWWVMAFRMSTGSRYVQFAASAGQCRVLYARAPLQAEMIGAQRHRLDRRTDPPELSRLWPEGDWFRRGVSLEVEDLDDGSLVWSGPLHGTGDYQLRSEIAVPWVVTVQSGYRSDSTEMSYGLLAFREPVYFISMHALWLCLGLSAWPIGAAVRWFRRCRHLPGHCVTCGYDLRAHKPGDRCPECGSSVSVAGAQAEA